MGSIFKSKLGSRILLLVIVTTLPMLIGLTISGLLVVNQSSSRVIHERDALAQSTARYLEYILRQNLAHLATLPAAVIPDTSNDLEADKQALHDIYLGSIFDYVFITDILGNVLWVEPYRSDFVDTNIGRYVFILQSLWDKKPGVSNVLTIDPGGERAIFMVSPLRNKEGAVVGLAAGWIDPNTKVLQNVTGAEYSSQTKLTDVIDIIDNNGVIVASNDPTRELQNITEVYPVDDKVTTSVTLSLTPWTIKVGQSPGDTSASVRSMIQQFVIIGLCSLLIAFILALGMARSLVRPINQLSAAAKRISQGDLSQPIPKLGKDEIGELGQSFDTMRLELQKSLAEIQELNRVLEAKVEERTRQLEASYREIKQKDADRGRLLEKVLTAQEEERKRIARELHDETTQALVAMVMRLEAVTAIQGMPDAETKNRLVEIKNLAKVTIDNVHKMIFDLRPSVLDDLGLLPAIRWYAEKRLGEQNVKVRIEITGEERKLPPQVEIALFRAVQEGITNIVRHAEASSVVLSIEFTEAAVKVEIEDDGKGFDLAAVSPQPDKMRGAGLLGIEERMSLVDGRFEIVSQPGSGTYISLEVPLMDGKQNG